MPPEDASQPTETPAQPVEQTPVEQTPEPITQAPEPAEPAPIDSSPIDSPPTDSNQPPVDSSQPTGTSDSSPITTEPVEVSPPIETPPPADSSPINTSPIDSSPSSPMVPPGTSPELTALFKSWLATYQRTLLPLSNAARTARKEKKKAHIVELVGKKGTMTRQEIILALHMSSAQIERYLHELVSEGRLRHVGYPNEGRYGMV